MLWKKVIIFCFHFLSHRRHRNFQKYISADLYSIDDLMPRLYKSVFQQLSTATRTLLVQHPQRNVEKSRLLEVEIVEISESPTGLQNLGNLWVCNSPQFLTAYPGTLILISYKLSYKAKSI